MVLKSGLELELEQIQSHMAHMPVLRGEVGCACVAREVSVERGVMDWIILAELILVLKSGLDYLTVAEHSPGHSILVGQRGKSVDFLSSSRTLTRVFKCRGWRAPSR